MQLKLPLDTQTLSLLFWTSSTNNSQLLSNKKDTFKLQEVSVLVVCLCVSVFLSCFLLVRQVQVCLLSAFISGGSTSVEGTQRTQ